MRRVLLSSIGLLLLAACVTPATVPDSERARLDRELVGRQRYLRVAMYAGPLWQDTTRTFITDQPGAELDLLENESGKPIPPPPPERVLAPGTPVRIRKIEFPTTWGMAERVMMTPRYNAWVYLDGPSAGRPLVIVLPRDMTRFDDIRAELDRVLTADDPARTFYALPQEQREAVLRKQPIDGMGQRALEMAWGLPEKKRIDRPAGTEEWTWPGGKRRAYLRDDRVEKIEK
ncbi:hypothetical protein [Anaeromyxobacter oryzisoli]|uniref:hypothetical protein n=1 Tax=Anaeromyxobacter oryzisoli TaxID=2925408 RepID=UPI001F5AB3EA|nr:hypothetical protein [Anaeromyxobacter sp. SG63]